MSKIQSVLHNFANHVTSGLSPFTQLAYEACEKMDISSLTVSLTPTPNLPESMHSEVELQKCVEDMSFKFADILGKQSGLPLVDVDSLVILIDFELHSPRVQAKQKHLASHRVSYAYYPIYTGQVSLRLKSGKEYCSTIQSHDA